MHASQAQGTWTTRVFAMVPAPGYPAMAYVSPQGNVYEGTFDNPAGSSSPSRVFGWSKDGVALGSWTVPGENLAGPHGVQVATSDARGRLVLLELGPPSALLLDTRTGEFTKYASFADLAPCASGQTSGCSPTVQDLPPEPDYAVWGSDGSLYVSDYQQALIWRVPPGGGAAQVWLADARFDGEQFGTAGLAWSADRRTMLVAQGSSAGAGAGGGNPTTGKLYSVPIGADGRPGALRQVWESRPADAPDGIAVASSGNIYVALVSPAANQIVELSPDGTEVVRYPSTAAGGSNGSSVPFDSPSSARFLGTGIVVANQSFVAGDSSHWAVLDVEVGEPGLAEYIPSSAGRAVGAPASSLQQAGAPSPVAASAPGGAAVAALPNTAGSSGTSAAASAVVVLCVVVVLLLGASTRRAHHVTRMPRRGEHRVRR
ncbi:MAG TPA: SMP-30/gluconolactonase/LRE family protein [Candidatus Dormibacteraeota bacterium]|nr:SMP-30/gluconolactonase/LRE family protein [Candidatus Dormibacteraeota bacterium]